MPRLSRRLPAYCLHKATGQAYVTLDGKEFYLGRWGTKESRAAYARLTMEWTVSGGTRVAPRQAMTVSMLLNAYWRHCQIYYVGADGVATSELATYRTLIRRLRKLYGGTNVAEFGPL